MLRSFIAAQNDNRELIHLFSLIRVEDVSLNELALQGLSCIVGAYTSLFVSFECEALAA